MFPEGVQGPCVTFTSATLTLRVLAYSPRGEDPSSPCPILHREQPAAWSLTLLLLNGNRRLPRPAARWELGTNDLLPTVSRRLHQETRNDPTNLAAGVIRGPWELPRAMDANREAYEDPGCQKGSLSGRSGRNAEKCSWAGGSSSREEFKVGRSVARLGKRNLPFRVYY